MDVKTFIIMITMETMVMRNGSHWPGRPPPTPGKRVTRQEAGGMPTGSTRAAGRTGRPEPGHIADVLAGRDRRHRAALPRPAAALRSAW